MELSLDRKGSSNYQRILICASTAITSALAFLTLTWYRRKRRRVALKDLTSQSPKPFKGECPGPEAQVEAAFAKVKELESLLFLNKRDKDVLGHESGEALKKLEAAAQTEKELRHQLGKVRFAAKEYEDSYNLIYRGREEALAEARRFEAEKKQLEAQSNSSKSSLSGVQRSLAAETGARKVAERRVKQLELEELEKRVQQAEAERKSAEQELERYKAQVAPTRAKIEAFGQRFVSMQESYQSLQQALRQTEARHAAEQKARKALEPRLKTAETRVLELEKELKITREAARSRMQRTSSRSSIESR